MCGCSAFLPSGCTLLPLCGARWSVGATRCGLCVVWSGLRRRVLVGVRLRGSRRVDLLGGWGNGRPSGVVCPSLVCLLAPVGVPSPPVPRLLVLPFPCFPVFPCPCVALPPVSCPCGRLPATLGLSLLPCCGPSLCPFPSRCAGGRLGGGLCGADGPCPGLGGLEPPAENFEGVGGAEALDRMPEEGFPCRLRHGGLGSGLVGVGRVRVRIFTKV